jgi:hypothetical protein
MLVKPARLVATATLFFGSLLLAVATPAQGCGSGTFWKRDHLPDVPSGLTGVSVIQGMCEGESAGVVFEMPANMPPQRITQVVAPWGAALGVNGFAAALDVEVYDGVSFNGASVNMGTQVFSLTGQATANMQVQSHALNTLDTSTYNIIVGVAPATGSPPVRRFAICFRTDVNFHPSGTCATGWPANFFTDNSQPISFPFTCNNAITPTRTCVMEIIGQGWRDPALATVQGIGICPLYYSGIFCIRCCSEDAFPAYYTTIATGCPSTTGVSHLVPAQLPRIGTTMLVVIDNLPYSIALMLMGFTNAPFDVSGFGLPGCTLQTDLTFDYLCVGGGGTAVHSLPLANDGSLLGLQLYQQAFVLDPPLNAFGGALSDTAALQIGN